MSFPELSQIVRVWFITGYALMTITYDNEMITHENLESYPRVVSVR